MPILLHIFMMKLPEHLPQTFGLNFINEILVEMSLTGHRKTCTHFLNAGGLIRREKERN